ncbi:MULTISPECIES: hypothetical protein [unclassified Bradyrhizobium]|uniref:hypothetical protein n=1 Tax=unclassified Bradyrhizobium TaxID=2631580 RepID=UPI002478F767|nr:MULTISPECIES: hypothetical protein [unclassified Bradyrhizobium]WGR93967.1 hypothetical protein MTX20_05975 [Bradyrhizobium sp. ISRA435]WGR98594.1 hypothetical protein MTX23_30955 [Bradyrhizobium sp. ISRA436]WGS05483.1 hypothetical protein MTX18_30975 [Bradyrhizobium sp. ISRA437]WGS12370.1 hypothetical protein MTX26_30975 [Bradyrhizobium sp. ISRA443]WGS21761.1 hypothetical protein MTX22_08735 [Bradyrhizobium sp. ISRA463]
MQTKIKVVSLAAATLLATTAGAFAQGYYPYGDYGAWQYRGGPHYEAVPPDVSYYPAQPGWYGSLNGTNHPTPSSPQGDVGPEGNNNGTLTGFYR